MGKQCEQIRTDLLIDIAEDDTLTENQRFEAVAEALGKENCERVKYNKTKKVLQYRKKDGKYELIIVLAVTFMGGKHSKCRHRSELKTWFKEIYEEYKDNDKYNVRVLGVYHYKGNIIFVEYKIESYLDNKMHNSAAWVYTNDLYQAMKDGVFRRIDKNNHEIVSIKRTEFKAYIDGDFTDSNVLYETFKSFNESFVFGDYLLAKDAIIEMHQNNWKQWKQAEWAGWFLEYRVNKFIEEHSLQNVIRYVGDSNKHDGELDFDLWFDENNFYGDLKASNIDKKESPGNDKDNFNECINKYDKFWYVIYEHETKLDRFDEKHEAARFRQEYIEENESTECKKKKKKKKKDKYSYQDKMKKSVKFVKMYIIELNKINYKGVLKDFNQGKQQGGQSRKPKFKIPKRNIDNYIVFSETAEDIKKRSKKKVEKYEFNTSLKVADELADYSNNNK